MRRSLLIWRRISLGRLVCFFSSCGDAILPKLGFPTTVQVVYLSCFGCLETGRHSNKNIVSLPRLSRYAFASDLLHQIRIKYVFVNLPSRVTKRFICFLSYFFPRVSSWFPLCQAIHDKIKCYDQYTVPKLCLQPLLSSFCGSSPPSEFRRRLSILTPAIYDPM